MTYEEIAKEYDKIHRSTLPRVKGKMDCNAMRRYLIKHKDVENVWFEQLNYKIDHNTTFCALPYTPNWKVFQKYNNHPYVQVYLLYLTNKGFMMLTRGGENDCEYAFYTSHLFDRYRERELQDLHMGKKEVVKEFFKCNGNICSIPFPTDKYPNNNFGITEKGVLFGEKISENIWLYKTYIRKDQLLGSEFEAALQTEEGLAAMLQYRQQMQEFLLARPYRHYYVDSF
jgi:hypothetical protein